MTKKNANTQKANKETPIKSSMGNTGLLLQLGVVIIITFLSFAPALNNGFINWDDNGYVFENVSLSKPFFEAVGYFFGPHYFIGNYIPLTMLAYSLEYHLVGLQPDVYHGVNVLIHLLNVSLVFLFIYLLSNKKTIVAAVVALFFGIHPMHVESVAWIAELKDVLYSFFFLAGVATYLMYLGNKDNGVKMSNPRYLIGVFVFFVFSILSKPAAVIFPLVLLLLDFYTKRKWDKWVWIEKLPFFAVSLFFGVVAIIAQQADRLLHNHYPLSQRFFFAAHSLLHYLLKFFLPINLSIFYPYPSTVNGHLPYAFYVAPILVVALGYGVYRTRKYTRIVAFGFLFYLINIVLVLQLLSVGDAIVADRYTYIPYIGLLYILAMEGYKLYNAAGLKKVNYKPVINALVIGMAITCSYITYTRCQVWENDDTIATDLLNKFPDDCLALNNKGFILSTQGRYKEAIVLYSKAIQYKPAYVMAHINLINAYLALKDEDNAMKAVDLALQQVPDDFNLINSKGYMLFRRLEYTAAMALFNKSIGLKPDQVDGYAYLAECYYAIKDYNGQMSAADAGLLHTPDSFVLLNIKGYALFLLNKYSEAVGCFKEALRIKPDFNTATANLSNCYRAMEDSTNAVRSEKQDN